MLSVVCSVSSNKSVQAPKRISVPVQVPQRSEATSANLKRTPLYDLHKEQGGKNIDFFGWDMPVQYKGGVSHEVKQCREKAAIFDVSHMGQMRMWGKDRFKFMERLVVGDITDMPLNHIRYSIITNPKGGAVDDTIITNVDDHLFTVVNAACFDKDWAWFHEHCRDFNDLCIESLYESHALIALQGPKAQEILCSLVSDDLAARIDKLPFLYRISKANVAGVSDVVISRCGYTGEDGFEMSVPSNNSSKLCSALLENPDAEFAGLGARDAIRLEAGLCLYGQDMTDDTSPVEAGLTWTIGKRRRQEGGFLGADTILRHIKEGVTRKRAGLVFKGAPAREGAKVLTKEGEELGPVTSGSPSPTIGANIAMAYVPIALAKSGTELQVEVRGKRQPAVVSKMPFAPHHYKKVD